MARLEGDKTNANKTFKCCKMLLEYEGDETFQQIFFVLVCIHPGTSMTKQTSQCQSVADRQVCEAFSIFRLVDEKIYFEVVELNIC